ncbi:uncharacterized protein BO97DRAFT_98498 [Aspergillus homomorphus CBS 101889]|uniref:Uncharacterized protein n=1 Tax=Aspergillus homomorphus (strain CBS 101889) TaxID=1450537 RepID=A0A395HUH7_ASPHC|nr:hypothetical protein BO97DRAFT_98498 [Aspergillus homomorphus CBS 101889]RAL11571.1 hypothetical protein BO97DRAFT_98498 [Aspergillus homomorphus CBS 101889]
MSGSMAEGISTSLQTCPPDPLRLKATEDFPSPPCLSHLHVNDPGLTPSPGSQLQHSIDASRDGGHGQPVEEAKSNSVDQHVTPTHADQPEEVKTDLTHKGNGNTISGGRNESRLSEDLSTKTSTPEIHDSPAEPSTEAAEDLYDPLFDSELMFHELDAAFDSRKRAGTEAFEESDLWQQTFKRQALESNRDETTISPDKTPSLLSLDSTLQPDRSGTGPHTPLDPDQPTPATLFEALGPFFDQSPFDVPMGLSYDGLPDFDFDELSQELAGVKPPTSTDIVPQDTPSISEATKQRFLIDDQDLIDSTSREVLQRVCEQPPYISPYPTYAGPLGYLPSAPNIHVRCIEVAEDRANFRLSTLKSRVQQLSVERHKLRTKLDHLTEMSTVDRRTGKTQYEMLRDENAMLRRVCTQHKNRVEQYKKETLEWKSKLHELGTVYNHLLYEIQVQKQVPAVTGIPTGYKPPRELQPKPNQQASAQALTGIGPHSAGPATTVPQAPSHHPVAPSPPNPEPVTIDLTADDPPVRVSPTPAEKQRQAEMLQSLRSKKYTWLTDADAVERHSGSPRPRQDFCPGGPQALELGAERIRKLPASGLASADRLEPSDHTGSDDLARMMEAELAQG